MTKRTSPLPFLVAILMVSAATPASGELSLSQLVVELGSEGAKSADIEIFNDSPDKAYLSIEPSELIKPGTPGQQRVPASNPTSSGLLVTPNRAVLEPGQRKRLRIAATSPVTTERVYRVLVRPVSGEVTGDHSGLKLLVGYDVLALVRPEKPTVDVRASRQGGRLQIENRGNVSVELSGGTQCATKASCTALPGKRLYPGASWSQELKTGDPVTYRLSSPKGVTTRTF